MTKIKGRGGKRPGAGRKKGGRDLVTLSKEAQREWARQYLSPKLAPVLDALAASAVGLSYMVVRDKKTGKFLHVTEQGAKAAEDPEATEIVEIWEKEPDINASREILNRCLDKSKEQEQDVNIQGGLEIRWKPVE